ncbi:MAG: hypothetical protein U0531_11385 [Dehalococcoidia bacterium]
MNSSLIGKIEKARRYAAEVTGVFDSVVYRFRHPGRTTRTTSP